MSLLPMILIVIGDLQSQEQLTKVEKKLHALINKYVQAREANDSGVLASILTSDVDQLVSSGNWRKGKSMAIKGMLRSSSNNRGKRSITVDQIRILTKNCALIDTKYEIQKADHSVRKMWSSFTSVKRGGTWKIAAIRNMLLPS